MATTTPLTGGTTATATSSGLAAYASPYTMDMLGRGQALTSSDPYHQYNAQRVAGLDPLQQQAGWSVSGLDAGNMTGGASNLAMMGGMYQPSTLNFGQSQAQQYMTPYMQNVIDVSNTELGRQSNIQGNYDDSKFAQQGAFGGSRHAIVDAERNRNLLQQQNNNQLQGQQTAYQNAQSQFNQDQTRQQADAQYANSAALQGSQALGAMGNQAFNQQMQAGALSQNNFQQQLNNNYGDFQGAVKHPYEQLSFMNNLVHGLPGSTTSGSNTYTPATQGSNWMQNLGNVAGGFGAVGSIWEALKGMQFNEGGLAKARLHQVLDGVK